MAQVITEVVPSNLTINSPPEVTDVKPFNKWIKDLILSLNQFIGTTGDTINQRPNVGLDAELPPITPGHIGRSFFATDTKKMYWDDGNGNWRYAQLT